MSDRELATKLCGQLLERVKNAKNKECLLNVRTVDEFDVGGGKVRAQAAAIHIAAYNDRPNSGVLRLLCREYGVDANREMIEELTKAITRTFMSCSAGQYPDASGRLRTFYYDPTLPSVTCDT